MSESTNSARLNGVQQRAIVRAGSRLARIATVSHSAAPGAALVPSYEQFFYGSETG